MIYLLLWLVIFLITELIYLTYLRMYRSRQKTRKVKKKEVFLHVKMAGRNFLKSELEERN